MKLRHAVSGFGAFGVSEPVKRRSSVHRRPDVLWCKPSYGRLILRYRYVRQSMAGAVSPDPAGR